MWWRKNKELNIVGVMGKKVKIAGEVTWSKKPYGPKDLHEIISTIEYAGFKDVKIIVISRGGVTRGVRQYIEEYGGIILTLKELSEMWDYISRIRH